MPQVSRGGQPKIVTLCGYGSAPVHNDTIVYQSDVITIDDGPVAIRGQSADVDIISGATLTSVAYARSLASALAQSQL